MPSHLTPALFSLGTTVQSSVPTVKSTVCGLDNFWLSLWCFAVGPATVLTPGAGRKESHGTAGDRSLFGQP